MEPKCPPEEALTAFARLRLDTDASRSARVLQPSPTISPRLRPDLHQRNTDPSPASSLQLPKPPVKARPRSPYARGHLRSHSANASLAPPMARTRSLPTVCTSSPMSTPPSHSPARPSSPLRPTPSIRSSPRRSFEDMRPIMSSAGFTEIESIAEDAELDLSRTTREAQGSPLPSFSAAFSRSNSGRGRRRPTSPLYQQTQVSELPARGPSPSFSSSRFNEPHPFASSATSSIPSTPSSFRSRSPSISSLETIPDSPDAEEEAAETYHIARLKAAADAADAAEAEVETARKLRDIGLVVPEDGASSTTSMWSPQRLKEKRKRWSVCGAERRGDFEMETIWED
ncbi:MAG: hypothetical protein Q9162_001514 [Coniocarpon cinnabarinum]